MHACQQDVIALSACMGISVNCLFDTAGMDIYFEQRSVYRDVIEKGLTYEHALKKIHNLRTPGLNQILERWGAPNGPNQYKENMKKVFSEAGREYFETRPIIEEFLLYSARDVEDLLEVQQNMVKEDHDLIWP